MNGKHEIYCRAGISKQSHFGSSWVKVPGTAKHVSCGDYGCWTVRPDNSVGFREGVSVQNCTGRAWVDITSMFLYYTYLLAACLSQQKLTCVLWCYSECISTPGKLKNLPDHSGNRTRDLWFASPMLCQLSYEVTSVRLCDMVRQIFQLDRCEYTLSNTTNTFYTTST